MAGSDINRQELFDQFLRCIDREENLIHYRMTWGMQWNFGFLAAIIAVGNIQQLDIGYIVQGGLALCGIFASIMTFIGIRAAHDQVSYLIKMIEHKLDIRDHIWEDSGFIRPYGDPETAHRWARTVSALFPLIFAVIWVILIAYVSNGRIVFKIVS